MALRPRSAPYAPSTVTPARIAAFESWQAFRRQALGEMADALELWRDCGDKTCRRNRRCGGDGASCLIGFLQSLPDAERRAFQETLKQHKPAPADVHPRPCPGEPSS
ncbi:MAG: hypothetical protein ACK4VM_20645, partial [Bosea sp. (in: a-proteobacteria)]